MRRPDGLAASRHDHPHNRMMTKAKRLPPLELLNKFLCYRPETGAFYWKNPESRRVKAGAQAGTHRCSARSQSSYIVIRIQGKNYFAHRLAWYFATGCDPASYQIDHINGDGLDNRIANLRLASSSENQRNIGLRANNTSGFKGVHLHRESGRWRAVIYINKRQVHLGAFPTPELAHMAYCKAAAELHGEFARAA
jgi:phage-related protein